MTPTEILHKIVETENKARDIHDEAVAMQTGFSDYVQTHVEKLKEAYAQREEKDVAAAENNAVHQADREIDRLDQKLEAELATAKNLYENHREDYVEKLFRLAVSLDA